MTKITQKSVDLCPPQPCLSFPFTHLKLITLKDEFRILNTRLNLTLSYSIQQKMAQQAQQRKVPQILPQTTYLSGLCFFIRSKKREARRMQIKRPIAMLSNDYFECYFKTISILTWLTSPAILLIWFENNDRCWSTRFLFTGSIGKQYLPLSSVCICV